MAKQRYVNTEAIRQFSLIGSLMLLTLQSCIPTVGLQSGRSLGKNNAIAVPYLYAGETTFPDTGSRYQSVFIPSGGFLLMTGIAEQLDFGFKLDLSSLVSLHAKYQILGTKTSLFAGSVGAEGGLAIVPTLIVGPYYSFSVPFTFSYHPSEKFYAYAQPVYYFSQRRITTSAQFPEFITAQGIGMSYGIAVGAKNRFSLEVGHYDAVLHLPLQVTVGYTSSFNW